MRVPAFALGVLIVISSACGTTVKPINLHDSNVPLDARRFIADAQDAVSISRARLDDARENFDNTVRWRNELTSREMWPSGAENVLKKLDEFSEARVEMARLMRLRAEVELDLAEAKYIQSTAETAMRNDIAVYDLKPIQARSETTRQRLENVSVRIEEHRAAMDKVTQDWWKIYGEYARKNEVPAFYMSPEIMRAAQAREQNSRKAREVRRKENPEETPAALEKDGQIKLGL